MAIRVTFHPGTGRFLRLVIAAIVVALLVTLVMRAAKRETPEGSPEATSFLAVGSLAGALVPVLALCVPPNANEAAWVNSLFPVIDGRKEVTVPNGRVDVLTDEFAVEVDFIQKWHEGLGQALHYASATGKRPALALILSHSEWPPTSDRLSLLRNIDRISTEQKIKVFVLRPGCV